VLLLLLLLGRGPLCPQVPHTGGQGRCCWGGRGWASRAGALRPGSAPSTGSQLLGPYGDVVGAQQQLLWQRAGAQPSGAPWGVSCGEALQGSSNQA
jgi:hypothetical protein